MARAHDEFSSLRFGRRESERVIAALLLSVLVHLGVWGGWHIAGKMGWLRDLPLTQWLHQLTKKYDLQAELGRDMQPDVYVDVSHADADAPQRTKYYSNKNSRAANEETAKANVPKIAGTQTDMPKTEDAPRAVRASTPSPPAPPTGTPQEAAKENPAETPKNTAPPDNAPQLAKLQPSMPPPSPLPEPQPELPEPQLKQPPGETDLLKPHPATSTTTPGPPVQVPSTPERPRTLKQALAQRDQLPGRQMQQDGGVQRRTLWPQLDVKATQFGDYDRNLIEAVQQRWYDLLDNHQYAQDRSGKVILQFKLKPDGSVIEMQTLENTVGELLSYLCQESVEEAAPFGKWPSDMAQVIGANYREITFTFYYY